MSYLSVLLLHLKPSTLGIIISPFPTCPFSCLKPVPHLSSGSQCLLSFSDLVLTVVSLSNTANLLLSFGSVLLAFKCSQISSMLRNNYNYNPSSAAWALPPAAYKSLSFPSPQNFLNIYPISSILSLPTHASVLSNLNSAPTASPKLPLLHFLLYVSEALGISKTELTIFSVRPLSIVLFPM